MTSDFNRIAAAVRSCYSTWGTTYYDDYYGKGAPYPPVQVDIVRNLLAGAGAKTLLDAGCGPASMLRELPDQDRYGFDLTPEMVAEARRVLTAQGLPEGRVWEGNVLDPASFRAPADGPAAFDAALCVGVMPHIPAEADAVLLGNLASAVRPGGLVIVEARNALFSLFTLNRYSREFFRDELIREPALLERARDDEEKAALQAALGELDARFRLDLPPVRTGKVDEPGYDEVLSRTHIPFEVAELARRTGLVDVQVLFYHYHALPPMLSRGVPELFRRESIALENPADWRGYFLASAFLVAGRRAP